MRTPLLAIAVLFLIAPAGAFAAAPAHASGAATPQPYADFVKGATVESGLIPIVRKDGKVYLAIAKTQLNTDFIQTAVPYTGLGGFGPAPGEPYVAPARIMQFQRVDDNVVLRWPNTDILTENSPAIVAGTVRSVPNSVIAVQPIVAENERTVVISADAFLGDVGDMAHAIQDMAHTKPQAAYHLDSNRTFFTAEKAFPENDVIRVDQTWESSDPDRIDNAPDPRSVEVVMTYNVIKAPTDGYMPRIYDPRVGYFSQALLNFGSDDLSHRDVHYITRWNFGPRTSAAPVQAANPMVFYLSRDIPQRYREPIRQALLAWNKAYEKIGILNAVQVKDQPADPNWDSDDIRYNVVRWFETTSPQYGAEALLIVDPRTGEEINVGVNEDAVMGLGGNAYRYLIAPARGLPDSQAARRAFEQTVIKSVTMHESGHDMGLQHNFIGSMAYTAKQLQSAAFTRAHGISNSVMEYDPLNLWPKGTSQGDYEDLALGPYDYHAIQYGYGYIAGAKTPQGELPVLRQWASQWSNPWLRFASDEDNEWFDGHAIDPRVVTYDLTNHPLQWCGTQMRMDHQVMNAVLQRFPAPGQSYEEARRAFLYPLRQYLRCAALPANTIGGEYLSRDAKGDPHASTPLSAVPRGTEYAAFRMLDRGLFADAPWRFNPKVLDSLTYNEISSLSQNASWAYNPPERHGVDIVALVNDAQNMTLNELYAPLTLQRIDELSTKYARGSTMTLADLFDWAQSGILGDLADGGVTKDGVIRRNLQVAYARRLASMWTHPAKGVPSDAQGLAAVKLQQIQHDCALGLRNAHLDELTRAHLQALQAIAQSALQAHAMIMPQ